MQKQEYILEKYDSFELNHIFECGQCFRWNLEEDGTYIGVIKNAVIKVNKVNDKIIFSGICEGNLKKIVTEYFDMNTNYLEIKNKLSKVDKHLQRSIKFGEGIRVLKQDLWECIISFIISANNNIPRIKKIIEKISKEYGDKIDFEGKVYYTFPTPEQLSQASIQDLRALGLGFRDKRVFTTTKMILEKQVDLQKIENMNHSDSMRQELLKLDGVGPKVADCIMLFSLKRFDVFPIDVWVRRVMNELYIHNENEEKVSKKELNQLAENKFLGIAGIAQQYLFYWKRETS